MLILYLWTNWLVRSLIIPSTNTLTKVVQHFIDNVIAVDDWCIPLALSSCRILQKAKRLHSSIEIWLHKKESWQSTQTSLELIQGRENMHPIKALTLRGILSEKRPHWILKQKVTRVHYLIEERNRHPILAVVIHYPMQCWLVQAIRPDLGSINQPQIPGLMHHNYNLSLFSRCQPAKRGLLYQLRVYWLVHRCADSWE